MRTALIAMVLAALLVPQVADARSKPRPECRSVAVMKHGKVRPPDCAPWQIRRAIRAANRIRRHPYVWGGGHSFAPSLGFDCSGAVSYVLRRAKLLKHPRASGSLLSWRSPGRGRWLTVWAHGGHAFMVIAGRRFDTSGGLGPRWHRQRPTYGFAARHSRGL